MVYVPLITSRKRSLERRKGGGRGGGGRGGSRGGSKGSSKGSTKSGSSSSRGPAGGSRVPSSSVPLSSTSKGQPRYASPYTHGSPRVVTIPAGQPFAGRTQGGGTRDKIYGTNVYGSGYPGTSNQRGVNGLGFPFYFWPLTWGAGLGYGAGYLHSNEYGSRTNATRPGGSMRHVAIQSPSPTSTYHVVADNATVVAVMQSVKDNCTGIANLPLNVVDFSGSTGDPLPESVIQYYRASSVALTLDGYNNTAALSDDPNTPSTPLPSTLDRRFLDCLNQTIGASVPLVESSCSAPPHASLLLAGLSFVVLAGNYLS